MAQFKVAIDRRQQPPRIHQPQAGPGAGQARRPASCCRQVRPDRRSADVQPGQLESNLPASVVRFKSEIAAADGLLFVTPEHNRSIPAVLKNAIDWGARPWGKNSWAGKPAAITGTSPGAIGTAVAQQHLRQILGAPGRSA